ncbi:MAG: hypothetical protein HOJ34_09195 [Kordiimonadaceae bacterium]|nr:hypothetical protein [Kordiimonadaceae bacterium]MBT6035582.1 hypothetical protein [Kordiimonadaceae bacterium]MBT6329943.1 hypothetical protein [Kordiimonadaceae bacterium]MBT7581787.1 hypothetical protein [Kordiimonadaceae bacterium]
MNSNIILIKDHKKPAKTDLRKNTNIFSEMEKFGIDPGPFLEIAAQDLNNQYGTDALSFSLQISQEFIEDGDKQSAKIWQKISCHLSQLHQFGTVISH